MCGYFGTKKKKKNSFTKLSFRFASTKYRNVWVFWNKKKKSGSNRCNPLNSSIDIDDEKLELKKEVGIHLKKKKPHRIYFFIKISIAKFGA